MKLFINVDLEKAFDVHRHECSVFLLDLTLAPACAMNPDQNQPISLKI